MRNEYQAATQEMYRSAWTELTDPESGTKYYHNAATRESRWDLNDQDAHTRVPSEIGQPAKSWPWAEAEWSKNDKCLAPFTGNKTFKYLRATIQCVTSVRVEVYDAVLAMVKFEGIRGYSEIVDTRMLQPVPPHIPPPPKHVVVREIPAPNAADHPQVKAMAVKDVMRKHKISAKILQTFLQGHTHKVGGGQFRLDADVRKDFDLAWDPARSQRWRAPSLPKAQGAVQAWLLPSTASLMKGRHQAPQRVYTLLEAPQDLMNELRAMEKARDAVVKFPEPLRQAFVGVAPASSPVNVTTPVHAYKIQGVAAVETHTVDSSPETDSGQRAAWGASGENGTSKLPAKQQQVQISTMPVQAAHYPHLQTATPSPFTGLQFPQPTGGAPFNSSQSAVAYAPQSGQTQPGTAPMHSMPPQQTQKQHEAAEKQRQRFEAVQRKHTQAQQKREEAFEKKREAAALKQQEVQRKKAELEQRKLEEKERKRVEVEKKRKELELKRLEQKRLIALKREEEAERRRQEIIKRQEEERIRRMEEAERDRKRQEFMKIRFDLVLEDSTPLPMPQPVVTRFAPNVLREAMALLQFAHVFGESIDLTSTTRTATFDSMEAALIEKSSTGLVAEFLIGFLWAIFYAEDFECKATVYGLELSQLDLNSFTISEILRLYLLTSEFVSGGFHDDANLPDSKALVMELSEKSFFDLEAPGKLSILTFLMNEILALPACREKVDGFRSNEIELEREWERFHSEVNAENHQVETKFAMLHASLTAQKDDLIKQAQRSALALGNQRGFRLQVAPQDKEELEKRIQENEETLQYCKTREAQLTEKHEKVLEQKKLNAAATEAKKEEFKEAYLEKIHENSLCKYGRCLGRDRHYRRVWIFSNIQGVFLEPSAHHPEASSTVFSGQFKGSIAEGAAGLYPQNNEALREKAAAFVRADVVAHAWDFDLDLDDSDDEEACAHAEETKPAPVDGTAAISKSVAPAAAAGSPTALATSKGAAATEPPNDATQLPPGPTGGNVMTPTKAKTSPTKIAAGDANVFLCSPIDEAKNKDAKDTDGTADVRPDAKGGAPAKDRPVPGMRVRASFGDEENAEDPVWVGGTIREVEDIEDADKKVDGPLYKLTVKYDDGEADYPDDGLELVVEDVCDQKWYCFTTEAQLQMFMSALNERGMRERELLRSLQAHKSVVLKHLHLKPLTHNKHPAQDKTADEYVKSQIVRRLLKLVGDAQKRSVTNFNGKQARDWEKNVKAAESAAQLGEQMIECYRSIDPVYFKLPITGAAKEEKRLSNFFIGFHDHEFAEAESLGQPPSTPNAPTLKLNRRVRVRSGTRQHEKATVVQIWRGPGRSAQRGRRKQDTGASRQEKTWRQKTAERGGCPPRSILRKRVRGDSVEIVKIRFDDFHDEWVRSDEMVLLPECAPRANALKWLCTVRQATNFSQLFIYLFTLEKSLMSRVKSIQQARLRKAERDSLNEAEELDRPEEKEAGGGVAEPATTSKKGKWAGEKGPAPGVGMRVKAYFEDDDDPYWEGGTIMKVSERSGQLLVMYDEGDVGWADYPDEGFHLLPNDRRPDTAKADAELKKRLNKIEFPEEGSKVRIQQPGSDEWDGGAVLEVSHSECWVVVQLASGKQTFNFPGPQVELLEMESDDEEEQQRRRKSSRKAAQRVNPADFQVRTSSSSEESEDDESETRAPARGKRQRKAAPEAAGSGRSKRGRDASAGKTAKRPKPKTVGLSSSDDDDGGGEDGGGGGNGADGDSEDDDDEDDDEEEEDMAGRTPIKKRIRSRMGST